ncbi:DUF6907 domain-containing protein [Streptosporangium canum]
MQQNLPAAQPCPPWCRADHTEHGSDRQHAATIGPFSGPGQVTLRYLQADKGGRRRPALARLNYLSDGEPRTMDLTPDDAYDWANIIGGLDIRSCGEFADALTGLFRTLGGGQ